MEMHTNNEEVKNWHDESDQDIYDGALGRLLEWEGIDRLDELISLMDSFVGNKKFKKFFNHYTCEKGELDFKEKSNPLIKASLDNTGIIDYFPLFPTITNVLLGSNSINQVINLIRLIFVHYSNHFITKDEDKVIKMSKILYNLTFFVEDYDDINSEYVDYDYDYFKSFFKRAKKVSFADKNAKKLSKQLNSFKRAIVGMYINDFDVEVVVYDVVYYLMVCNALKDGRSSVTCEDVVIGHLTCYNLIFNDIRPLVCDLYDEDKWGVVNVDFGKSKSVKKLSENSEGFRDRAYRKIYDDALVNLSKYDVEGLDDLISLMDSFAFNREALSFFDSFDFGDFREFDVSSVNVPFFEASNILKSRIDLPLYAPNITHKLVGSKSIPSIVDLLQLIFIHYNNHSIREDEDKVIKLSGILCRLTFLVEDFCNLDCEIVEYDYDFYVDFFKKARKVFFKDDGAKNLSSNLEDLITGICSMNGVVFDVHNLVQVVANYLMVCNALKDGRSSVNCDDIVMSYFICYRLIFDDVRSLVYDLYDEDRWGEVNKDLVVYVPLDMSPFNNIKK